MKNNFYPKNNKGYTIIETMVAVSLFLIIVTIGMNSLLNANLLLNRSKDMRSIMDNLSFIMEDMSRNIRTGSEYRCYYGTDHSSIDPQSCTHGAVLSFKEVISGYRWAYKFEAISGQPLKIYKTTDVNADPVNWVQLNDDTIEISNLSGFSVLGAEPFPVPSEDLQQPFVTIRLIGQINYKDQPTPFSLQNSVSQTTIDNFDPSNP